MESVLILLFGSVAKGEFTQRSDADVLVVFAEPVGWLRVYACSDGRVQPVVKTVDELVDGLRCGEPFWCEIIEDGIVLYEKGDTWDRLRALVEEAKAEYGPERMRRGWRWTKVSDK